MRFAIFLAVGAIGVAVSLAVTYVLTEFAGLWYFVSFLISTVVSWSCIFVLNALITFRDPTRAQYPRRYGIFLLGYGCVFIVSSTIVYTLTSVFAVPYLLSIIAAAAVAAVINFSFSTYVVYR